MQITPLIKSALTYFGLVFGAGFFLGALRVTFLVPSLGLRVSELIEAPLMLIATVLAARFVSSRMIGGATERIVVGLLALILVLLAELGLGLALRGMSPTEVLFNRDLVAGVVYYLLLLLFAAMPRLAWQGDKDGELPHGAS